VSGETILSALDGLAALYPAHIEKEDRAFFIPCGLLRRGRAGGDAGGDGEIQTSGDPGSTPDGGRAGKACGTAMAGGEELSVRRPTWHLRWQSRKGPSRRAAAGLRKEEVLCVHPMS